MKVSNCDEKGKAIYRIPPDCFDTGDGFYDTKSRTVYKYLEPDQIEGFLLLILRLPALIKFIKQVINVLKFWSKRLLIFNTMLVWHFIKILFDEYAIIRFKTFIYVAANNADKWIFLRYVTAEEESWIVAKCRKESEKPIGYRKPKNALTQDINKRVAAQAMSKQETFKKKSMKLSEIPVLYKEKMETPLCSISKNSNKWLC